MSPVLLAIVLAAVAATLAAESAPGRAVLRQKFSHAAATVASGTISADGQFVAFVSKDQLLPADRNVLDDIYVLDRRTETVTLETVAADGGPSNGSSGHPQLSGDGQYLAFESVASNLVASRDSNDVHDIFVRDRAAGTTTRVSRGRAGDEVNGKSVSPAFSADGRFVAFVASATNLVAEPDANGILDDVYLVSLKSGETTRVSVDTSGRAFPTGFAPRISADGRLVVFTASARVQRPADDRTVKTQNIVYLRDTVAATTTCISCDRDGAPLRQAAFTPDISGDGRIVAFMVSSASDPKRHDIAVHDRFTSETTVVTRQANARSGAPRLSADGLYVVFESWASDLTCSKRCSEEELDDNLLPDVYLLDRNTNRFRRLSGERRSWWSPSRAPGIDARGTTVVFSSREPYGPEDGTVDFDLYVCDPACQ